MSVIKDEVLQDVSIVQLSSCCRPRDVRECVCRPLELNCALNKSRSRRNKHFNVGVYRLVRTLVRPLGEIIPFTRQIPPSHTLL